MPSIGSSCVGSPAWKTGIRITLRGTAISADYLYNFRATECGPGPAEVDGKGVIGPASPRSSKVTETMYKYLQNILKFSNCVLLRVSTNNNNYEQLIGLFVIILAKNSFMNQHGVIYCWCQVGVTVTTSIIKSWCQVDLPT